MSTYKNIRGKAIKSVSTNLSDTGAEGQIWFNTTDNQFKSVIAIESFTSVSALNTARDALQIGSVGTQTAGIAFGGRTSPPETEKNETEEYNGSGWSESGNLNDARFAGAGFGTQTAAVMAGGNRPGESPDGRSDVEEYDGSSWTNATDIPAGRYGAMGAGTLTAGIVAGGATGTYPFTAQSTSFEYDGTNWTSGGTMNKGRWIGASGGPQTAALFFGGSDTTSSPNTTNTESYDGTSFTALSALPTATRSNMGSGDTSSAVSYGGGNPSAVTTAFTWDGSSWSTSPATLGTARDEGSSSGTGTAAVTGGGSPPDAGLSIAEEYNKSANVITQAAWSSGGTIGTARAEVAGAGDKTAGLIFGGSPPTASSPSETNGNKTEEYDGSSWTAGGTKNNKTRAQFGLGTQTAAVACGGYRDPVGYFNGTEEYDGSSWTNTGNYPTTISNGSGGGCGTQTAGFNASGYGGSSYVTTTAEYDGSSWTAGNAYPISKQNTTQLGTQTAALSLGGHPGATEVFTYDGTNFAATTALPGAANQNGRAGTQTSAIIFTGQLAGTNYATVTQQWNGSTWTTGASVAIARAAAGNGGATKTSAFVAGGHPPSVPSIPSSAATEEFTGESSTLNVKTLTQS